MSPRTLDRVRGRCHLWLALALFSGVFCYPCVQAAVMTVNTTASGSHATLCTLEDAVAAAETNLAVGGCPAGSLGIPGDAIRFNLPPGPQTITPNQTLRVSDLLTILGGDDPLNPPSGASVITIDGSNAGVLFDIGGTAPSTLPGWGPQYGYSNTRYQLYNLALTGAKVAVHYRENSANLLLVLNDIHGNEMKLPAPLIQGSAAKGIVNSLGPHLLIFKSAIRNNTEGAGDGIIAVKKPSGAMYANILSMKNASVYDNAGTGIYIQDALAHIHNSTISENRPPISPVLGEESKGSGIVFDRGALQMYYTTLVRNESAHDYDGNTHPDGHGIGINDHNSALSASVDPAATYSGTLPHGIYLGSNIIAENGLSTWQQEDISAANLPKFEGVLRREDLLGKVHQQQVQIAYGGNVFGNVSAVFDYPSLPSEAIQTLGQHDVLLGSGGSAIIMPMFRGRERHFEPWYAQGSLGQLLLSPAFDRTACGGFDLLYSYPFTYYPTADQLDIVARQDSNVYPCLSSSPHEDACESGSREVQCTSVLDLASNGDSTEPVAPGNALESPENPRGFSLGPNPMAAGKNLKVGIPADSKAKELSWTLVAGDGRPVRRGVVRMLPGQKKVILHGFAAGMPAGVYLLRLRAGMELEVLKVKVN